MQTEIWFDFQDDSNHAPIIVGPDEAAAQAMILPSAGEMIGIREMEESDGRHYYLDYVQSVRHYLITDENNVITKQEIHVMYGSTR